MNVLIIGSEGQLGRELMKLFPTAIGTTHKGPSKLDITNESEITSFLKLQEPDLIINASAMTNVDLCEEEKDLAMRTNGYAVRNIADFCRETGSYFVQISTDYVFDGFHGMYKEESPPNPINYYGLSKLVGDIFAQCCPKSLIVRTSGVFGHSNNFPRYAFNTLRDGKILNVIEGFYSPIHARLLAKSVKELIEQQTQGIINLAGERISRIELAMELSNIFHFDNKLIRINSGNLQFKAKRPMDSSLDISKARVIVPFDFYSTRENLGLLSK